MPIPDYGVLKGRVTGRKVQGPHGKPPHLHVFLSAGGSDFDVAVNILSTDGSEILYYVNHAFTPSRAAELINLPDGRTLLPDAHPLALDFVRQNLVQKDDRDREQVLREFLDFLQELWARPRPPNSESTGRQWGREDLYERGGKPLA
jgi:hypothetical protein